MKCPVCESDLSREIGNLRTVKLYFCKRCKSNFLEDELIESDFYSENYFNETYSDAYGKSYIDDEANIRNFSKRRLNIIKKLIRKKENISLLDIGCALGFFCDEAKRMGFISKGVEISKHARDFAEKNFGIECFKDISSIREKFDCITIWFTLEHLSQPLEVLQQISSMLNEEGIIALSLPNGYGGFFRFNRKGYLKKRPVEHIFEPSIKGIKHLLDRTGFKIERLEIFGLHPERFGLKDCKLTRNIQRLLKLGDTFEVYARKLKPIFD
ncbi:MAG: class I SAM-dependent methyltransferase [Brevinematia bacterium]